MLEVSEVRALPNYRIWVRVEDGVQGERDLSDYAGTGVFEAWKDETFFRSVHVAPHGSIAWDENIERTTLAERAPWRLGGRISTEFSPRAGSPRASLP